MSCGVLCDVGGLVFLSMSYSFLRLYCFYLLIFLHTLPSARDVWCHRGVHWGSPAWSSQSSDVQQDCRKRERKGEGRVVIVSRGWGPVEWVKRRVEKRRTGLFSRVLAVEVGLVIAPSHACPLCSQLNCLPHSSTILQVAPARWRFCRRVEHRRSYGCRLTSPLGWRAGAGAAGVSSVVCADMALKSSCYILLSVDRWWSATCWCL